MEGAVWLCNNNDYLSKWKKFKMRFNHMKWGYRY